MTGSLESIETKGRNTGRVVEQKKGKRTDRVVEQIKTIRVDENENKINRVDENENKTNCVDENENKTSRVDDRKKTGRVHEKENVNCSSPYSNSGIGTQSPVPMLPSISFIWRIITMGIYHFNSDWSVFLSYMCPYLREICPDTGCHVRGRIQQ